jgi:hypothetical protein
MRYEVIKLTAIVIITLLTIMTLLAIIQLIVISTNGTTAWMQSVEQRRKLKPRNLMHEQLL